jgi:cation:H+ antiporter
MGACIILVKSSFYLVRSTTKLSAFFGMTEFAIGFILMAFSTSIPELFVSVTSAMRGMPEFVLGNVIGSNIINLTLVIGIIVIVRRGINVESKMVVKDSLIVFIITILPVLLMLDQNLNRLDALVLIGAFFAYNWFILRQEKKFERQLARVRRRDFLKYFVMFVVSIVLLLFAAQLAVISAERISINLGIPAILIGLIILALGTSLPELFSGTVAAVEQHDYLAVGDILGSVVTNATLVLGIAALISPIYSDFMIFLTSSMFMIISAFIFTTNLESDRALNVKEGVVMLLLYVLFIMVEFTVRIIQTPSCIC